MEVDDAQRLVERARGPGHGLGRRRRRPVEPVLDLPDRGIERRAGDREPGDHRGPGDHGGAPPGRHSAKATPRVGRIRSGTL